MQGKYLNSALAVAIASYLSIYPVLLLPSLALLCLDQRTRQEDSGTTSKGFLGRYTAAFGVGFATLLCLSAAITGGSWEFIASTYGNQLLVGDLTPNVGLWWYFFIEMFDSFREFFLGVFWLHLASYVVGLCVRLRRQPLFVTTTMLGIIAIFKPYPSVSDTSLYLALLPLYQHVFPRESHCSFVASPMTDMTSHAIQLFGRCDDPLLHNAWPRVLLPLDSCRFRKCQLLLCHHLGVELRSLGDRG